MSGPTREQAERAAEILAAHRDLIQKIPGDYPACTQAMIVEALDLAISRLSIPLPPEDGERARLAAKLEAFADRPTMASMTWFDDVLRTGAALLRQAPAGVGKEEAAALIKAAFRHLAFLPEHPARWQIRRAGENLVKAIEALPEAAPCEDREKP